MYANTNYTSYDEKLFIQLCPWSKFTIFLIIINITYSKLFCDINRYAYTKYNAYNGYNAIIFVYIYGLN